MRGFAWCAGIGVHHDAGGLALEGCACVGDRTVGEVLRTNGCDRTRKVALLLDTVTDDDGFLEELAVLFKCEIDDWSSCRGHRLGRVSYARNGDAGVGGHHERIRSVDVCHCSKRGIAHDNYGCADDRFSVLVDDLT